MKKETGYICSIVAISILFFIFLSAVILMIDDNKIEKTDKIQNQLNETKLMLEKRNILLSQIFSANMTKYTELSLPVTLTAYTASKDECNSSPETTAFNMPSRVGYIALSRDMFRKTGLRAGDLALLFDEEICIGLFTVADKMSSHKHKGTDRKKIIENTVDVLHATKESAKIFGVKQGKLVWIK